MCGFCGWMGPWSDPGTLESMTAEMALRGPDGQGQTLEPTADGTHVAFGHRRLSIIDISAGSQPMESHDGRYVIAFNGEIYNYVELRELLLATGAVFRTRSDTEVILEAWREWGPDCLSRFRGMFAFALFDRRSGELVLARDPFGKKPLYIVDLEMDGRACMIFGSQISSLMQHPAVPRGIDPDAIHQFLCWRYVPGPLTMFKGIRKLPPGCYRVWRDGRTREVRFWEAPEEAPAVPMPAGDPVDQFLDVFDESVRLRLRADVPLGAFLSSGLDSTAIVATLVHQGLRDVRTFSVGFEGDEESEVADAARTAQQLGTLHREIRFTAEDLFQLLPDLSRLRGAPITEAADIPIYIMSREAAKEVKVVLSGEGSDELFGGYPKHRAEMSYTLAAVPRAAFAAAQGLLRQWPKPLSDPLRRADVLLRAMAAPDFQTRMVAWFGGLTDAERAEAWRRTAPDDKIDKRPFHARSTASRLGRVLHFDQTSWLPDNLLDRMDSMTMAASIEARAPFMDVRLAAFSGTLPDQWKIGAGVSKRILREAMRTRIPPEVLSRRKLGFRLPVARWFRGPLKEAFADQVLGPGSRVGTYVDTAVLRRIFSDHLSGRRDHARTLWSLFALETFLETQEG